MSQAPKVVEEAVIILQQLGGKGFLLMTGASNLFAAGRSVSNPSPWLRMDLPRNQSCANRFRVTLTPSDTYRVEFYHQKLVDWQPVISKEQAFDSVHGEDLPELFRSVTGFETRLPTIIRAAN